jgi:hypothetical protein
MTLAYQKAERRGRLSPSSTFTTRHRPGLTFLGALLDLVDQFFDHDLTTGSSPRSASAQPEKKN